MQFKVLLRENPGRPSPNGSLQVVMRCPHHHHFSYALLSAGSSICVWSAQVFSSLVILWYWRRGVQRNFTWVLWTQSPPPHREEEAADANQFLLLLFLVAVIHQMEDPHCTSCQENHDRNSLPPPPQRPVILVFSTKKLHFVHKHFSVKLKVIWSSTFFCDAAVEELIVAGHSLWEEVGDIMTLVYTVLS